MRTSHTVLGLFVFVLLSACSRKPSDRLQGYVEGEFIYVASPLPGALETLHVRRGAQVKAGDPLFELESVSERTARDEAERRLAQARANLEDAKQGKRPSEVASVEAQLEQARAALALSEREFKRQDELTRSGAASKQELDRVRSTREQDRQRVAQLEAELKTTQLGSRVDQIAALEADVKAREFALTRAEWDLSQKRQVAPESGLVFDTLYRQGEWVPAGRPVLALLPPKNIKVRAFVPEGRLGSIHPGQQVRVTVDGIAEPFLGSISYISPHAEYTPPVIYSQESRGKLVFMIEAVFEPQSAAKLHPGQPIDLQF
jgi:HlyD family secretion protein